MAANIPPPDEMKMSGDGSSNWEDFNAGTHRRLLRERNLTLNTAINTCLVVVYLLQNYSLRVVHKPGPNMFISDLLNRATAVIRTQVWNMSDIQFVVYNESSEMWIRSIRQIT